MIRVLVVSVAAVIGLVVGLYALWGDDAQSESLIVQASGSGSLEANDDGSFTLTLNELRAITWFTDRPERKSGTMSIETFEISWREVQDDPPNAVLEVGDTSYPMELVNFTLEGETATYTVRPLDVDLGISLLQPASLTDLNFQSAALFIDAFPTAVNNQITDS